MTQFAPTPPSAAEPVVLTAEDGYQVNALRYRPAASVTARVIVAGATGVPQRFYRRFAEHAVSRGLEAFTIDYRGIGLSRPSSLKGFRMNYLDWARLDLAALVERVSRESGPIFMVGHSFGGHAFGLLPNHDRIAKFYTFATGAGWHGWMPRAEQVRVLALWRLLGPVMTRLDGYLAWSRLGMGEDLPLDVYRQWRRWCSYPRYFFDDPEMRGIDDIFARVKTPIIAANALDDAWAPPASRDAFMKGYTNAQWRGVDLDPRAEGLGPIGHMGYFRAQAKPLWDRVLDWFGEERAA
jgi:predicted alpha/beta hydrolase